MILDDVLSRLRTEKPQEVYERVMRGLRQAVVVKVQNVADDDSSIN